MQRDTHLTFGEIYGTREALLADVEKVLDVALVEVDDTVPLQLRFITPREISEDWYTDDSYCDYKLTEPQDHSPGMNYVTVSYCWKHSQAVEELPARPEYRMWGADDSSNGLRCPEIVFHRAIQYAKHRRCPYIWIDQECINQEDPADIERHLQVMHRVYSESKWTAAILSVQAPNKHELDNLKHWFDEGDLSTPDILGPVDKTLVLQTLQELSADPWFWRTWTFQERACTPHLDLLMPLPRGVSSFPDAGWLIEVNYCFDIGIDLCVDFIWLTVGLYVWEFQEAHREPDLTRCDISKPETPNELDNSFLSCYFTNKAFDTVRLVSYKISQMTEACDNLIVADRVSIVGNVHTWYGRRLLSNRLNCHEYSLSGCLFALWLANFQNGRNPEQRRQEVYSAVWDDLMECTYLEWCYNLVERYDDDDTVIDHRASGQALVEGR
jgi:hypothetical protein